MLEIEQLIKKSSVLIVDDEKNICAVLKIYLSGKKFKEVFTAGGYDDAAAILKSKKIDLVISDIKLNGKSGIDLLKYIKQKKNDCEVILMTAYSDIDNAVKALNYGAYAYITKPFNDLDKELFFIVEGALKHQKFKAINTDLLSKLKSYYKSSEEKIDKIKLLKKQCVRKYPFNFQNITIDYINQENLSYHFNFSADAKKLNFYFLKGGGDFYSATKMFYDAGYFDGMLNDDNFALRTDAGIPEAARAQYSFQSRKLYFAGNTKLSFFSFDSVKKAVSLLALKETGLVTPFNSGDVLIAVHFDGDENLTSVIREEFQKNDAVKNLSLNLHKIFRQYTKDYAFTVIAKK